MAKGVNARVDFVVVKWSCSGSPASLATPIDPMPLMTRAGPSSPPHYEHLGAPPNLGTRPHSGCLVLSPCSPVAAESTYSTGSRCALDPRASPLHSPEPCRGALLLLLHHGSRQTSATGGFRYRPPGHWRPLRESRPHRSRCSSPRC